MTLIGATTENPSFEVISPLLSRCQVYILKSLEDKDLQNAARPGADDRHGTQSTPDRSEADGCVVQILGRDARKLLNILDILAGATEAN